MTEKESMRSKGQARTKRLFRDPGFVRVRKWIRIGTLLLLLCAVFWVADADPFFSRNGLISDRNPDGKDAGAALPGTTVGEDTETAVSPGSDKEGAIGATSITGNSGISALLASAVSVLSAPESSSLEDPKNFSRPPDAATGGVAWRMAEGSWGGRKQRVHVLSVDPAAKALEVRPVLSFDQLFGYETLGDMAKRNGALAAVNGGFGPPDGRPAGAVMLSGTFLHPADPAFPTLVIGKKDAKLVTLRSSIRLDVQGRKRAADFLNPWPMKAGWALFTPVYGRTDRIETPHLTVSVSKGKVVEIRESAEPVEIPVDGFLLAASGKDQQIRMKDAFRAGNTVSWSTDTLPAISSDALHALSCGSWLVRDGKNVAPLSDPWAGSLAGPAPRTAVGIGREGQLVFVVAEGRVPGGVSGLTGKELGDLLTAMGLREAALLDGGASSELITNGKVRNTLSADRERLLPSGFVLVPRPVAEPGE